MSQRLGHSLAHEPKFSFLKELNKLGYQKIIGVDEVGRGALAGPVVVAAVEVTVSISGVDDSKKISRQGRVNLAHRLHSTCQTVRFGISSNEEIDTLGLSEALKKAYDRALALTEADIVLTDHFDPPNIKRYLRATRGESLFYPVAAASIVAKVYRDQLMRVYDRFFPDYRWSDNVGYATSFHRQAIAQNGPSPLHRKSFL